MTSFHGRKILVEGIQKGLKNGHLATGFLNTSKILDNCNKLGFHSLYQRLEISDKQIDSHCLTCLDLIGLDKSSGFHRNVLSLVSVKAFLLQKFRAPSCWLSQRAIVNSFVFDTVWIQFCHFATLIGGFLSCLDTGYHHVAFSFDCFRRWWLCSGQNAASIEARPKVIVYLHSGFEATTAKGSGADTCPCDRCCSALVLEAIEAPDPEFHVAIFTWTLMLSLVCINFLSIELILMVFPFVTIRECMNRCLQVSMCPLLITWNKLVHVTLVPWLRKNPLQSHLGYIFCQISFHNLFLLIGNGGFDHIPAFAIKFFVVCCHFASCGNIFIATDNPGNFGILFAHSCTTPFTSVLFHSSHCTASPLDIQRGQLSASNFLEKINALQIGNHLGSNSQNIALCHSRTNGKVIKPTCSMPNQHVSMDPTVVPKNYIDSALRLDNNTQLPRNSPSYFTHDLLTIAILAFVSQIVELKQGICIRPDHPSFAFDATLGYPGEGPEKWTCITANVESLATHPHFLHWQDDVQLLQEIRVAQSNYNDVKFRLNPLNRTLHCSSFLELKQQKNAAYRIPHGGTGIIGSQPVLQPFEACNDATGRWPNIACTTRVTGAWVQVLPKLKILAFSFYGHTCHTDREEEIHEMNNQILSTLFEICAQFGDIPIVIGGDFQKEPESYEAFQYAKQTHNWIDPLAKIDEQGNVSRPYTFSRTSNFDNPVDGVSSIDALLLNPCAAAALDSIEVITGDARQHAPIRASFTWPRVYQKGHVLIRPAPFDFTNLKLVDGKPDTMQLVSAATYLWEHKYALQCTQDDDKAAWQAINQYGVDILLECGAKFGKGPKTRGTKPQFREKTICPGQSKEGYANTNASAALSKTHSLIAELMHRLHRKAEKQADMEVTHNLQNKIAKKLKNNPMFPGWDEERHMNTVSLGLIQKILQKEICTMHSKEKYDRIKKWRIQMKEGTATKNVDKTVFQWVKQKQAKQSANLIVGEDGHVIFNPIDAITETNSQWDSIYSVNALHDDPLNILACVWPHIQKLRNPIELQPISGIDLKQQVLSRRSSAAPGLDGWRTIECQLLPIKFYDAIASFFNAVEGGSRNIPDVLVAAKQVILDKPFAQDTPLQKRVLTILPVMLLAYTGLRYKQLQKWQQETMPCEIYGGIKGRKMTDVHTRIRLEIDHAKTTGCHLLGVKLDKSKCFDRLIPTVTAALFLAFSLPAGISMFFAKMYLRLHRYMNYKEWTSNIATTSSNGLAQGCSLSLLAINVHMAVWHVFIQHLPVLSATFIDDCYLWVSITNAACIEKAIELTEIWDKLCGQKLNLDKCQIWSTNARGRKILKDMLPTMQLVYLVEILGARIQTSEAKAFHWPPDKTRKICQDVKNIAAIPCNRELRDHLISAKAIPQLSFSPHISSIPKIALQQIQDEIARTLWKGRPKWRSKLLLIGVLAKPHRTDPFLARSYNIILDCFSFLKNTTPALRLKWKIQAESSSVSKNSIFANFMQACTNLNIMIHDDFKISLWGCEPFCFLDFHRKELKNMLALACRHRCYHQATRSARKDTQPSQGILHFHSTMYSQLHIGKICVDGLSLNCHHECILTGCTITRDRSHASGFNTDDKCRFCKGTKESMSHIVNECTSLPVTLQKPEQVTECGPNFDIFGLVEISLNEIPDRLKVSSISEIAVADWSEDADEKCTQLWTDGSLENPTMFFQKRGGYAVVDENACVISSGIVSHFCLSSYTTELWALIVAFCGSPSKTHVHTDCKSLADQANWMCIHQKVDFTWTHISWWTFLLDIFRSRRQHTCSPLRISWCPAHQADDIPFELITPQIAASRGCNYRDLLCNKKADAAAKRAALRQCSPKILDDKLQKIQNWQIWLSQIHVEISKDSSLRVTQPQQPAVCDNPYKILPSQISTSHSIEYFKHLLPKWAWNANPETFLWTPACEFIPFPNSHACLVQNDWDVIVTWMLNLRWKEGPNLSTSWLELASQAWHTGVRLQTKQSPRAYMQTIQKVVNQIRKVDNNIHLVPGEIQKKCKSNGKTHPIGRIDNAQVFVCNEALKCIAVPLLHGANHKPSSWDFGF